jgi:hypothetical protein
MIVVVLLVDPAPRAEVGRADQLQERLGERQRRGTLSAPITGFGAVGDVRAVVDRRLVAELLDRQVGHDLAVVLDDEAQVSVVWPMTAKSRPHLRKIAAASSSFSGSSTMSMRSWLSDSIIS